MEEILASIRRIIADDQPAPPVAAAPEARPVETRPVEARTEAAPVAPNASGAAAAPRPAPAAKPAAAPPRGGSPPPADDVLDLIGVPVAPKAEAPAPAPNPASEPARPPEPEISLPQVPEPAHQVFAPGSAGEIDDDIDFRDYVELEPEPEPVRPPRARAPAPAPTPYREDDDEFADPVRHLTQGAAQGSSQDPGLISHDSGAAVSSAFNTLATTILTQNARTLEDLVKEMLRPMLKGWLDQHLPAMVERMVRAEIERVTRGRS
jgi:cell pole-organizing protein PopZ